MSNHHLQHHFSNSPLEEFSDETPPKKYKSSANIYAPCQFGITISDPMSYEEVVEKEEWKKAMVEEMQSIEKNWNKVLWRFIWEM